MIPRAVEDAGHYKGLHACVQGRTTTDCLS